MQSQYEFKNDLSIVICGEAGQGVQTMEVVLTHFLKQAGYHVFAMKEYMSRVRGGSNSIEIRLSSQPTACPVNRIDLFIPLDDKAIGHVEHRLTEKTIIIGDNSILKTEREIIDVPVVQTAKEIGHEIFANVISAGILAGMINIKNELMTNYLKRFFSKKDQETIDKNCAAVIKGSELGQQISQEHHINIQLHPDPSVNEHLFLNGHQAVSLGAIAGGCDFVSSYPMSPSTGVLTALAQWGEKFGILVEQAEDEISAINMALGSWYAGGRALVTTSGGGFALMAEGLSLAGCIESPAVIHLAQRPGPATGLPTRTEQGDLDFALFAGHGEFPRAIFCPGTLQDAFLCTQKAFEVADEFQIPSIILTDQYMLDSYYNFPKFDLPGSDLQKYVVRSDKSYRRYQITKNGISPRAIPGEGEGLVCVDSDEHDQDGFITESMQTRIDMMDKRLKKLTLLKNHVLHPEFYGDKNYKKLIFGWGSTVHVIKEAILTKYTEDVGFLYFKQAYPISEKLLDYTKQAEEIICIENNATGQFAKLIRRETGLTVNRSILKYDGMPFFVEELLNQL